MLRAFLIIHTYTITGQVTFNEGTFNECIVLTAFLVIHIFTIFKCMVLRAFTVITDTHIHNKLTGQS